MAGMMTGLDIGYRTAGAAEHPLVGLRMPDFELTVARDRRRAHTLLRTGRGLLLGFTGADRLARDARPWVDRVDHLHAVPREDVPASAMLVRPDGHVCWTSGTRSPHNALASWFGAPNRALAGDARHDVA
jgi:hypothetical protein